MSQYWEDRRDAIYLFVVKQICKKFSPSPSSVIDIGSNGTPTLEWFRTDSANVNRLVSLDLRNPYVSPGVESIKMNLMNYQPTDTFDLVTCLQVLEHVPDPTAFGRKLLDLGRIVIVSVPYRWPKGACKYHIHDPVTSALLQQWMGKQPKFKYIAKELNNKERLIHVYLN